MRKLYTLLFLLLCFDAEAQIFEMKKSYTGYHFAFSPFKQDHLNLFVVQFNRAWADDIETGFSQYSGNELGQSFTTSGLRVIWGNTRKWTASSDYAFGSAKDKNEVKFRNGISQHLVLRSRNHQVNLTFGMVLKEDKYWLEGIYSTNLGKVFIEYSTEYSSGVRSYGTEYKLNGIYTGFIKTTELGFQASRRHKKNVFYARFLFPVLILGPDKAARNFIDEASTHSDPRDFPSNYDSYLNDTDGYYARKEALQSSSFKGISYGIGMFHLIGKNKEKE